MDRLLQDVVRTILYWLQIRRGMILLSEPGSKRFIMSAQRGVSDDKAHYLKTKGIELERLPLRSPIKIQRQGDNGIQTQGDENLDPIISEKFTSILSVFDDVPSVVIAPIIFENETLGLLVLENSADDNLFSENMRNLLMGISSQVAVSIAGIFSYQKLEESEQRFRRVFDHAASGIALLNLSGGVIKINTYLNAMLGYSEAELRSKKLHDLSHPEDSAIGSDSSRAMLNGEITSDLFEKRLLNKNGKTLWVLISLSLLRDNRGKPLHFIALLQDLTEQKAAEMERDRLERQLQQSQKMEAISTLAGGIAHDFNNILTAIIGFAQLGLAEKKDKIEGSSLFEHIISAAQRAADLVRQILTFSRQQEKEMEPIQIAGVIREAIKFIRATLPSNIEIRQNIDEESGYIMADATQMHQVILNLCTNAHHAMLPSGGVLTISLSHEKIKGRLITSGFDLKPGHYVKLSISDTGCGMDGNTLQKVFDPYFTTKEKGKGTGLGMSVVHGIVKNHNGMISINSKPGLGTQVEIFLPRIYLESAQPEIRPQHYQESVRGTEKILLIDDEPDILKIGAQLLQNLGYTITTSSEPEKALEMAIDRSFPLDLVITDLTMPNVSGDNLAKTIREKRPELPVILCTGYAETITEDRAREIGVSELLVKPFKLEKMAQSVRRVLDRAQSSLRDNPA